MKKLFLLIAVIMFTAFSTAQTAYIKIGTILRDAPNGYEIANLYKGDEINVMIKSVSYKSVLFSDWSYVEVYGIKGYIIPLSYDTVFSGEKNKYRVLVYVPATSLHIGMNMTEAINFFGTPDKINKSVGSWGTHEQWCYKDRYLYFENGILTSWQE
jgi:hypothetical protein